MNELIKDIWRNIKRKLTGINWDRVHIDKMPQLVIPLKHKPKYEIQNTHVVEIDLSATKTYKQFVKYKKIKSDTDFDFLVKSLLVDLMINHKFKERIYYKLKEEYPDCSFAVIQYIYINKEGILHVVCDVLK